jgi:predicted peptidase
MIRLISLVTFLLMSHIVTAQRSGEALFDKLVYLNGSSALPYRLLKPEDEGSGTAFPLVIFLHGAGERGNDNQAQLKHVLDLFTNPANRKNFPCYVLAPQCPTGLWWTDHNRDGSMKPTPTPTMQLVIELIEKISKENKVDPLRIYLTGVSMGGFGVWDLLARFPTRFAAAIPICGGADVAIAKRINHVPQWIFHGAKDKIVHPNQSRRMVKALHAAGANPRYTEYPEVAHGSWVPAYAEPDILPWFFAQKSSVKTALNQ